MMNAIEKAIIALMAMGLGFYMVVATAMMY